jgi:hypothetical protein
MPEISRKRFAAEEDEKLRQMVIQHGTHDWVEIAAGMGNRSARQCRDRWNHYLTNAPNGSPWTEDEDKLVLQTVERIGVRWKTIAQFLPSRSDMDVKQRWSALFRVNHKPPLTAIAADQVRPEPLQSESGGEVLEAPSMRFSRWRDMLVDDDVTMLHLFESDDDSFPDR